MILDHDLLTNEKTRKIFAELTRTKRIVDVGCGIRPCPAFQCEEYVCIEPHEEYVEHLKGWEPPAKRLRIVYGRAVNLDREERQGTTVLLLDVIEHMERSEGEAIKKLVEEFEHAVIFTPLGWYEQEEETPDCWGLNGGYWQRHRSAWGLEDFPGWQVHSWEYWHPKNGVGAILAIR